MGSRRGHVALRRRAAIALGVWAVAFALLAAVAALPGGPTAVLHVDDDRPVPGETVHFNASASTGHDSGKGRIVGYRFAFGDGQGTEWQPSPLAEHAYAAVGNVSASVTVVDNRQQESTASLTVHVGESSPPPGTAPDLVPIQARPDLAAPRVNDSLNVTVVVLNRGGAASSATLVAYDEPPNATAFLVARTGLSGPIASSATVSVVVGPFVLRVVGNHTLRFVVTNATPPEASGASREFDLRILVLAATGPQKPGGGSSPLDVPPAALGLGAAAIAAGVGAAYLLLRRPPRGPLEPPPASPPDRSPPPLWPP